MAHSSVLFRDSIRRGNSTPIQGDGRVSPVSFNSPITPVKPHSKTSSQYTLVPLLERTNMVAEGNQAAGVYDREPPLYQHEPSDNPRRHNGPLTQRYIHWLSPTVMIASLIAGVCFAIGHHCYYTWLNGRVVGNVGKQQWALRFGNAFATVVALCLKTAVGIAYIQHLWRTLRYRFVSLKTINDAFGIGGNILSFLNWELWRKVQTGAVLALVLWCIPLSTLLPPATLSVGHAEKLEFANMQVLKMDISNSSLERVFTYRSRADISAEGASARLGRIIGAVVSGGERLSFQPPSSQPNTSYALQVP